jgi:hypothetical protein
MQMFSLLCLPTHAGLLELSIKHSVDKLSQKLSPLWCGEILLQFDNNETKVAACPVTDQNDN